VNSSNSLREELSFWVKEAKSFKLGLKEPNILRERSEI
jgi:hypothetical protein